MPTKTLNQILEQADGLKNNFYTAVKVSKMLEDENASIKEISEVISVDTGLTTTVLKLCNSAYYGFARKITTIRDAISILGFKSLKSIIYTIVSKSSLSKEMEGYGLAEGELWKNSVSCAVYSRYIAKELDYKDPDQAFTAGLLRDIGKMLIHEHVKEDFDKIMKSVNENNVPFKDAEQNILGFSHNEIGALAADKWGFPQVLIDVIRYHHAPLAAEEKDSEDMDLIRIVHLGDYLTIVLGNGIGKDGLLYDIDFSSLEKLGIDATSEKLDTIISEVVELSSEVDTLVSSI